MFWQERSSTRKATAQSSWRACVCDDIYYKLVSEAATDPCQKCPPGTREMMRRGHCTSFCIYDIHINTHTHTHTHTHTGLICQGNATVKVVVAESNWTVAGPVFRLQDCPFGYAVYNGQGSFNAEVQQCLPCDKGEECTTPPCVSCTPCEPGFFKSAVGTAPCTACPANTYREAPGASELVNCKNCLVSILKSQLLTKLTI